MIAYELLQLLKSDPDCVYVAGYPITSAVYTEGRITLRSAFYERSHTVEMILPATAIKDVCASAPAQIDVYFHALPVTGVMSLHKHASLHLRCRLHGDSVNDEEVDSLVYFSRFVERLSLE